MYRAHDKRRVNLNNRWELPAFFRAPTADETLCLYIKTTTTIDKFQTILQFLIGDTTDGIELVEISTAEGIDNALLEKCVDIVAAAFPNVKIEVRKNIHGFDYLSKQYFTMENTCYYHSLMN